MLPWPGDVVPVKDRTMALDKTRPRRMQPRAELKVMGMEMEERRQCPTSLEGNYIRLYWNHMMSEFCMTSFAAILDPFWLIGLDVSWRMRRNIESCSGTSTTILQVCPFSFSSSCCLIWECHVRRQHVNVLHIVRIVMKNMSTTASQVGGLVKEFSKKDVLWIRVQVPLRLCFPAHSLSAGLTRSGYIPRRWVGISAQKAKHNRHHRQVPIFDKLLRSFCRLRWKWKGGRDPHLTPGKPQDILLVSCCQKRLRPSSFYTQTCTKYTLPKKNFGIFGVFWTFFPPRGEKNVQQKPMVNKDQAAEIPTTGATFGGLKRSGSWSSRNFERPRRASREREANKA